MRYRIIQQTAHASSGIESMKLNEKLVAESDDTHYALLIQKLLTKDEARPSVV